MPSSISIRAGARRWCCACAYGRRTYWTLRRALTERGKAALEAAGLLVHDVVVLIDRQGGGSQVLEQRGYRLHSVLTLAEVAEGCGVSQAHVCRLFRRFGASRLARTLCASATGAASP